MRSGYGRLIATMAEGLDIRTRVTVRAIEQRTAGARVTTDQGDLDAAGVIVTASTSVLASGAIRLTPGPAADLMERMGDVPCGSCEKVAFALSAMPGDLKDTRFLAVQRGRGEPATNFQIVHGSAPMILCHIAGDESRALAGAGAAAMTDHARAVLMQALGADVAQRITATATTNWTRDPLIQGSYSHARPGAAQARRDMIAADTGRVAFAGEALSLRWQTTAHGAYASGRDVAARMAETVGAQPAAPRA